MKPQTYRAEVWEGLDTQLMAEVVDNANRRIQVQDVEHISIALYPTWDDGTAIHTWAPAYQDTIFDTPQTNEDDPAWPYSDSGYNFRWTLPMGALAEGLRTYRLEVVLRLTNQRKAVVAWALTTKEVSLH